MKKLFIYSISLIMMSGLFFSCNVNEGMDDVTLDNLEETSTTGDDSETPNTTPPPPPSN